MINLEVAYTGSCNFFHVSDFQHVQSKEHADAMLASLGINRGFKMTPYGYNGVKNKMLEYCFKVCQMIRLVAWKLQKCNFSNATHGSDVK